ncbi:hypothetical protein OUZ56_031748 [Daphnia magna]|uniref:Uncharacterized protein n=1 Tax=Daphnia magna TaxID=35525 RepID=A0ABQ9ZV39_9CRUS|nr:hypothetical protein OUZ56_031748 [Daphnia magna]
MVSTGRIPIIKRIAPGLFTLAVGRLKKEEYRLVQWKSGPGHAFLLFKIVRSLDGKWIEEMTHQRDGS